MTANALPVGLAAPAARARVARALPDERDAAAHRALRRQRAGRRPGAPRRALRRPARVRRCRPSSSCTSRPAAARRRARAPRLPGRRRAPRRRPRAVDRRGRAPATTATASRCCSTPGRFGTLREVRATRAERRRADRACRPADPSSAQPSGRDPDQAVGLAAHAPGAAAEAPPRRSRAGRDRTPAARPGARATSSISARDRAAAQDPQQLGRDARARPRARPSRAPRRDPPRAAASRTRRASIIVVGYGGSTSMLATISLARVSSALSIAIRSAVGSTRTDSVASTTGRTLGPRRSTRARQRGGPELKSAPSRGARLYAADLASICTYGLLTVFVQTGITLRRRQVSSGGLDTRTLGEGENGHSQSSRNASSSSRCAGGTGSRSRCATRASCSVARLHARHLRRAGLDDPLGHLRDHRHDPDRGSTRAGDDVPEQVRRHLAVRERGLAQVHDASSARSPRSATGSAGRSCSRSSARSSATSRRRAGSRARPGPSTTASST